MESNEQWNLKVNDSSKTAYFASKWLIKVDCKETNSTSL